MTNQLFAIISVDYTEFKPQSYQGVLVSYSNELTLKVEGLAKFDEEEIFQNITEKPKPQIKKRFYTGDFHQDLKAATEFAKAIADEISYSSSIDAFISDMKRR